MQVGIAIVQKGRAYLVGLRPPGKPLAGYSEFPGGKWEPGETSAECAVRECEEETGLQVRACELLLEHSFRYPHGELQLAFWRCELAAESPTVPLHGFRWVLPEELWTLTFPEANASVLAVLRQRELAFVGQAPAGQLPVGEEADGR